MSTPPRYIVGIDLGTTNSVVSYAAPTPDGTAAIGLLEIAQLTAPGAVERRTSLPSFLYRPAADELPPGALTLPWGDQPEEIVGSFARSRGAEVPHRLVSSAKSWLCYAGANREAAVLPWNAPDEVAKVSPVEASTRYLAHLAAAWNDAFPEAPLNEQEILLTVPASFDVVARELTIRAASAAGLDHVTVLEEPQAAFYAWLASQGDNWRETLKVGDLVLVCDIGGGTTDFTLIAVRDEGGQLGLERIAVGNHILLGGDNMDLALAYAVREQLSAKGNKIDEWQFRSLTIACRDAKERLLGDTRADKHAIALLGRGKKLIGGTLRTEIERSDIDRILLDGFVPACRLSDAPQAQRRTALQEIGLPYASDPGITRHLADFLTRHAAGAAPTAILFNGGVTRASVLRNRLLDVTHGWFPNTGEGLRVLSGDDPEHAVACGAVYYGMARRGRGVRIRGGAPRSYYVGIEVAMPAVPGMRPPIRALCVVPKGVEEGSDIDMPPQEFGLVVGEPSEFRFLTSTQRDHDAVGTILEHWDEEELTELAPLETTLHLEGHDGSIVPVQLSARLNELGVLELWCVSRDGGERWKLEFNVRTNET